MKSVATHTKKIPADSKSVHDFIRHTWLTSQTESYERSVFCIESVFWLAYSRDLKILETDCCATPHHGESYGRVTI